MLRKIIHSFTKYPSSIQVLPLNIRKPFLFYTKSSYFSDEHSKRIKQILQKIKINVNGSQKPLLESGMISHQHFDPETHKYTINLNLTKDYMKIKNILKQSLLSVGISDVDIGITPRQKQDKTIRKNNINKIKKIIAVSSCKGGVGKSTIAINIAANFKNMGFKVGIFDSDIYGPSLPTLINKQGETIQASENNPKQILPIYYQGLTCMSFGWTGTKHAPIRGPMVSSIVSQLLNQTQWGQLDYLVVDMPPGTGDIQISLCQQLQLDGAMIITTPQRLAFIDVIKGIQMFQDLKVRILGVIENMSHYQCSKCGHQDFVFGLGYTKMIMEQFGIQNAFKIPLMADITKYSDYGTPITFVLPQQHSIKQTYNKICQSITTQLKKPKPKVNAYYNSVEKLIIIQDSQKKKIIDPYTLRISCRCAGCIDQLSGAMILKKQDVPANVYPIRMEEKGNYAVAVVWSDGHRSSIYSYKRLFSEEIKQK